MKRRKPLSGRNKNRKKLAALILALVLLAGGAAGISAGKKKAETENDLYDQTLYVCDEKSLGCIEVTSMTVTIYRGPSENAQRAKRTGIYSETYSVYETKTGRDSVWYRIGKDRWVRDCPGLIYHAGSDASEYPPGKALEGTYRSSRAVVKLREDGTCTVRDLSGTFSLSSGTYSSENGNVFVFPDEDSPLMLFMLQQGIRDAAMTYRITGLNELTYLGVETYVAESCDTFVKGEDDIFEDPEALVYEYLYLAAKGDREDLAPLLAEGPTGNPAETERVPWPSDLSAERFETGIPVSAEEETDSLNETYGLNGTSYVTVPADVCFTDGSEEPYEILLVCEDGIFHIAGIGSVRSDPQ